MKTSNYKNEDIITFISLFNVPIINNEVSLSSLFILKLEKNSKDISEFLSYKLNSKYHLKECSYLDYKIKVIISNNLVDYKFIITIKDISSTLVLENKEFEIKAKKYESNYEFDSNNIVLCGSSSMEMFYNSKEFLLPFNTINVGIGGTKVKEWKDSLFFRLVLPYLPKHIVIYIGSNNCLNSEDPINIGKELVSLFELIHSYLPSTLIHVVDLNCVPKAKDKQELFFKTNELIYEFSKSVNYIKVIYASKYVLNEDNLVNDKLFLNDGIHMNNIGYSYWGEAIKESLKKYY